MQQQTIDGLAVLRSNLIIQAVIVAIMAVYIIHGSAIINGYPINKLGLVYGQDFLNIYHYGVAAWGDTPAAFYDPAAYNARLDSLVPNYPDQSWSYPPHLMLLMAPLGGLHYNAALLIFTALGLLVFHRVVVRDFPPHRISTAAMWLMPTVLLSLICGQLSLFIAAIFVGIYKTMDTKPWLAGLLIALLTVKPQLGFLFPVFLVLTARWRVFGFASLFSAAFIGSSILIYGLEPWRFFIETRIGDQMALLISSHPLTRGMMPSAAVGAGMAGLPNWGINTLQALVSLLAIAVMVWAVRRSNDRRLRYCAFLLSSCLATPYLMVYDTSVLIWVVVGLTLYYGATSLSTLSYKLWVWMVPAGVMLSLLGVPGITLVLVMMMAWLCQIIMQSQQQNTRPI